ncbi:MAG TPA: NAD(P)/FAD-dependent oxidoreductase, partial [Aeromicrobium sp.]|nr:NAD(P)/FAD-dependent oxidoreductase [Aeromicrobium sp.]
MDHDVAIVGAGFGGMGAAIALQRAGVTDVVILEREDDLGGTWYVNHYPGLTVDIPSATYSYSFEPNPDWPHVFARGHELKAYCDRVADKYQLRKLMRFGAQIEAARWDDDRSCWVLALAGGDTLTVRYLISATGFLSEPKLPEIAGIDSFAGTVVHTAQWDDSLDLAGRRVAVIG